MKNIEQAEPDISPLVTRAGDKIKQGSKPRWPGNHGFIRDGKFK